MASYVNIDPSEDKGSSFMDAGTAFALSVLLIIRGTHGHFAWPYQTD